MSPIPVLAEQVGSSSPLSQLKLYYGQIQQALYQGIAMLQMQKRRNIRGGPPFQLMEEHLVGFLQSSMQVYTQGGEARALTGQARVWAKSFQVALAAGALTSLVQV